ncbi:MAG: ATP-binding protein [Thermoanaerobaculia bacterium]|nr:ATP-binding protein [Thermoanaerobaculia bacterium]
MSTPSEIEKRIEGALECLLRDGRESELLDELRVAPLQELVRVLARALEKLEGKDQLLLAGLVRRGLELRPSLAGRINRDVKKPGDTSRKGLLQLKRLADERTTTKGAVASVATRLHDACTTLQISAMLSRDLRAVDFDPTLDSEHEQPIDASVATDAELIARAERFEQSAKRKGPNPATRARHYLQAAKHLLATANPGDYRQKIFFNLGGYCAKMGQVYSDLQRDMDLAQDYLLQALIHQRENLEFLTELYFRATIKAHALETGKPLSPSQGVPAKDLVGYCVATKDRDLAFVLTRALLRLAAKQPALAWRCSGWSEPGVRDYLTAVVAHALPAIKGLPERVLEPQKSLDQLTAWWRDRELALKNLLNAQAAAKDISQIGACVDVFVRELPSLPMILRPREVQSVSLLAKAAEAFRDAAKTSNPGERRGHLRRASPLVDQSVDGIRGLPFAVDSVEPVVQAWRTVLEDALDATAELITPKLSVELAKRTYLMRGDRAEVHLKIRNGGPGAAFRLALNGACGATHFAITLDDVSLQAGEETTASLLSHEKTMPGRLELQIAGTCLDIDGREHGFKNEAPLIVGSAPSTLDFESLRHANPFNAGDVVDDAKMFFGRDGLLARLEQTATSKRSSGSLRILFGQRRVGKTSILHFLQRRLQEKAPTTLVGSLTWLRFSKHGPGDVVWEIAKALADDARRVGVEVHLSDRKQFASSYSVEFNALTAELLARREVSTLVVMLDEFDKALWQFASPDLDYGEPFYSFLRGLSMSPGMSLIVAGGESLPEFLKSLGPAFNNAKRERATYLDLPAITALVRNEYVSTWLRIDDGAVQRLWDLTRGNPFFCQLVCEELVAQACDVRSTEIDDLDVQKVASYCIAERIGPESVGHLYGADETWTIEPALLYLASRASPGLLREPWVRLSELAESIRASRNEVEGAANRLIEREVLVRRPDEPDCVKVMMPLFSEWFRQRAPLKEASWKVLNS